MARKTTQEIMLAAWKAGVVVPAFNIPYLPMMAPVVRALRDTSAFGLVDVARLEWLKFQSKSMKAVREEYERVKDERYTRLHLDHIPVIDEDHLKVDFEPIMAEALELGFESVMLDASRLPLEENIEATARVVGMAHAVDVPVEAELGAILGHEAGPLPPYEELFESGKGFTDPDEARQFVEETGVDWLSVAVGSIHGAISEARKEKKLEARLNIEHLDRIREAAGVPLVLHGGTGIRPECLKESFRHGIAKINIATAIRQPYEAAMNESVETAQESVYNATVRLITEDFGIGGTAGTIT